MSRVIQAVAFAVKVTPHFGQRSWVELMRSSSDDSWAGIWGDFTAEQSEPSVS
jgi:hypothetical protein